MPTGRTTKKREKKRRSLIRIGTLSRAGASGKRRASFFERRPINNPAFGVSRRREQRGAIHAAATTPSNLLDASSLAGSPARITTTTQDTSLNARGGAHESHARTRTHTQRHTERNGTRNATILSLTGDVNSPAPGSYFQGSLERRTRETASAFRAASPSRLPTWMRVSVYFRRGDDGRPEQRGSRLAV